MSVVVQKSRVEDIVNNPNFNSLIKEYGDECAILGLPAPETRISAYYELEKTGFFDVFAAYENEQMIGFVSLLAYPSAHYGVPMGVTESYFVAKDKRNTGAGAALRKAVKKRAFENGLKGVIIRAPVNGPLAYVLEHSDDCIETHRTFFMKVANE